MKNLRGVTLVELMIASGIMMLVAAMMLKTYTSGSSFWEFSQEQATLQAEARNALNAMATELKSATRTASGRPPNILIPTVTPINSQIQFYLPQYSANGDVNTTVAGAIVWDNATLMQYVYVPATRRIIRWQGAQQQVLAHNVENVTFWDDSSLARDEVEIDLVMSKNTTRGKRVRVPAYPNTTLIGTVKLRN